MLLEVNHSTRAIARTCIPRTFTHLFANPVFAVNEMHSVMQINNDLSTVEDPIVAPRRQCSPVCRLPENQQMQAHGGSKRRTRAVPLPLARRQHPRRTRRITPRELCCDSAQFRRCQRSGRRASPASHPEEVRGVRAFGARICNVWVSFPPSACAFAGLLNAECQHFALQRHYHCPFTDRARSSLLCEHGVHQGKGAGDACGKLVSWRWANDVRASCTSGLRFGAVGCSWAVLKPSILVT